MVAKWLCTAMCKGQGTKFSVDVLLLPFSMVGDLKQNHMGFQKFEDGVYGDGEETCAKVRGITNDVKTIQDKQLNKQLLRSSYSIMQLYSLQFGDDNNYCFSIGVYMDEKESIPREVSLFLET